MKTIGVLGSTGFIGSNVVSTLDLWEIALPYHQYDMVINCAGFSRMYEGSKNPDKMQDVEDAIFDKIQNIKFKQLIHLSTIYIDVYPNNIYSYIKKQQENRIREKYPNTIILRLGGVIGKNLKKNVVYDLINDKPLYVTEYSVYNYISAVEIGNIVKYLINNPIDISILNVGASQSISAKDIAQLLNKTPSYGNKTEIIFMDILPLQLFYKIKTSKEYIEEFNNEYSKMSRL